MEKISIKSEMNGSVSVVTVSGRIDSDTSPTLDAELTKIVGGNAKIVIDLKGVDYMSSAGIRAVVKAVQAAEKDGGAVKLASVPELVNSILYTVGLNQKVSMYPSVDEAAASF